MKTYEQKKQYIFLAYCVLFVLLCAGLWGSYAYGKQIEKNQRAWLLLRTKNIAAMLDRTDVASLAGSEADLANPSYLKIKKTLMSLNGINTDTRFIYLMGLSNNTQFFYVDSEDPSSADYSPPGEPYLDATPMDIGNHSKGIAYTNGPYRDEWGRWISGYAPVIDESTGQVLALLGFDIKAERFITQVWKGRGTVALVTILVVFGLFLLVRLLKRSTDYTASLEKINQDLLISKEYLLEVEHIAHLGQITWTAAAQKVTFDTTVKDILGVSGSELDLNAFFDCVDPGDMVHIRHQASIAKDDEEFLTFKYGLTGKDKKEHQMISVCKINRDSKGQPVRVVCTAQDMTGTIS